MSQKSKKPFRPVGKVSRLTFTEEERADPNLEKSIKKAEKAGDKLEKAQDKIPKKKSLVTKRTIDAKTGKAKVRLYFEESDKPKPPSKFSHKLKTIPQRELLAKIHKEIREGEEDNVGVEAAHKTEQGGEFVSNRIRIGYHSHKLKPYRQLARAEKKTAKAEVNYLYKKSLGDNPKPTTNPISRWQQKQAIKKEYIAKRYGKGAKTTKETVGKVADTTEKITRFAVKNHKTILIILGLGAALLFLMSAVSSCSVILEGGLQSVVATSYTSEDEDIIAVDKDYTSLEQALQVRIDNIENEYPGYDEYQYHLDEIGHNPFTLASYLTAKLQVYTRSEIGSELKALFDEQYTLTTHEEIQVRYRTETRTDTWTDSDGNTHSDTYTVEVPYDYYILHVT